VSFDRVARPYAALERIAFGRALERARFAWIDEPSVRRARHVGVFGEGDGRFAARLAASAGRGAEIECWDASAAMIRIAARRLRRTDTPAARVRFHHADIETDALPDARYDLVVTHFFLDCFEGERLARVVERIARTAAPEAHWLFTDFALPGAGAGRLRARARLAAMYAFFRATAGLRARRLDDPAPHLRRAGFAVKRCATMRGGSLNAELWIGGRDPRDGDGRHTAPRHGQSAPDASAPASRPPAAPGAGSGS
jgi:ubiquinone/menaquinone biosynthesis C-methylase UbiE